MRIIEPSVDIIEEPTPIQQIERIGRICYKSEDKITEDSAPKFIEMLVNRKHFAMLEHGVIHFIFKRYSHNIDTVEEYLCGIPGCVATYLYQDQWLITISVSLVYNEVYHGPWLMKILSNMVIDGTKEISRPDFYVAQVTWLDIKVALKTVDFNLKKQLYARHTFISAHFVCDRGVSHELVRHCCAAAQESTRYCNYGSDKFGTEVTFIRPSTIESWTEEDALAFCNLLEHSEQTYLDMISRGRKPQEARAVLPNALKTEVVLTMSRERWDHFLNLRSRGLTGAPHPDMKVLANKLLELIDEYDVTHS